MTQHEAKRFACRYVSSIIDSRVIPDDNAFPDDPCETTEDMARLEQAYRDLAQELWERGNPTKKTK